MEDKNKLILGVEKPIWLSMTGSMEDIEEKIIGWTTQEPKYNNGFIDKGSVLIFSSIYEGPKGEVLNFTVIKPGDSSIFGSGAEFFQKELDILTKEKALTLLNVENVDEIAVSAENVFIKFPPYRKDILSSYDARVFGPKDLYVIMGINEMKLSKSKINKGQKISLKKLIELYAIAVGQGLL